MEFSHSASIFNRKFLSDSHNRSSTDNVCGFSDLLVYSAIFLFRSIIRSFANLVVTRIISKKRFDERLFEVKTSIGIALG